MKPETKAVLETLLKREVDETDLKIFEVLTEHGMSEEEQHPVKFSLDFGKRCYLLGGVAAIEKASSDMTAAFDKLEGRNGK